MTSGVYKPKIQFGLADSGDDLNLNPHHLQLVRALRESINKINSIPMSTRVDVICLRPMREEDRSGSGAKPKRTQEEIDLYFSIFGEPPRTTQTRSARKPRKKKQ